MIMKGQWITDEKQKQMLIGIGWIVGGVLVALLEAVLPIFRLKGLFACFVGIPFIWIGVTKCVRAGKICAADVLKLARDLNGAITPEWVVTTFDCKPSEAEEILNELRDAGLIRLTPEGIDDGRMIFEVCLEDDPRGAARQRIRQRDEEDRPPPPAKKNPRTRKRP